MKLGEKKRRRISFFVLATIMELITQNLANLGHVFPCEIIIFSGQNLAKTPCYKKNRLNNMPSNHTKKNPSKFLWYMIRFALCYTMGK
jgi:hypothetical protein